jgi:hypothetical protein
MCDACLEMELYFAYLSDVEAQKQLERQKAQPWECEVTVVAQDDAQSVTPPPAFPPAETEKSKSRFRCDELE